MDYQELLYPHEDLSQLATASVGAGLEYNDQLCRMAVTGLVSKMGELRGIRSPLPYQVGMREQYAIFNGHYIGAELVDKGRFSSVMERIGYLAPRTVVVE